MKVINAIKAELEKRFATQVVIEPSNAIARKEMRVIFNGLRALNRLSTQSQGSYIPYEMLIDVVISARVSGGNTSCFLANQQMQLNILLTEYLTNELLIFPDIGERLPIGFGNLDQRLEIVGDAELFNATKQGSGWSAPKDNDNFEHQDELFTWREDWQVTLAITVHKHFINPKVTEITSVNQLSGESSIISGDN